MKIGDITEICILRRTNFVYASHFLKR